MHRHRHEPQDRDIQLKNLRLNRNDNDVQSADDNDDDDTDAQVLAPRRSSDSSTHSFELYTPDEERAVLKKLDVNLVLFMSFLYMLSFLDRSNIGNAKIAGMTQDLHLKDDQFDWLLTAFYITYILFEWMIMLYHILTPHVYISICVLSWGLIASLQAVVTTYPQLLILRTLLGISEAAFSPGVPFYLSFFFRREELALRAGMQVSAAPLAASFAGSLAWAITKLGQKSPFAPWRLLFLVEGFPSVVVAVVAWHFVPDSPGTAKFLTERQRRIAQHRLRKENRDAPTGVPAGEKSARLEDVKRKKKIDWSEILSTLKDPKCYLTALMFSCCNIAFSSMPVFLPSIIKEMGYSSINSQALSAPPFLVAFVVLLLTAKASDKYAMRSPFVCSHALLGFAGYALIAAGGYFGWPNVIRYLCVYPAAAGFFSAITIIITWTMNNQESNAKKGMGMTILNVIGQCGPLLGTRLFPDSDKPTYVRGMIGCAAAMLVVFILAVVLRVVLVFENRRRAKAFDLDAAGHASLMREGQATVDRRERFVLML